jgi:hypothetical protein
VGDRKGVRNRYVVSWAGREAESRSPRRIKIPLLTPSHLAASLRNPKTSSDRDRRLAVCDLEPGKLGSGLGSPELTLPGQGLGWRTLPIISKCASKAKTSSTGCS